MPDIRIWDGIEYVEVPNVPIDPEEFRGPQGVKGEPGEPGIAPDEVANLEASISRVDPGADGEAGDQYRVTVHGPRWRAPNSVSPRDFLDNEPDGATNNYAAIMQAADRLGTRGGVIDLEGRHWRSNTPIELTGAVTIVGGFTGQPMTGESGAVITFPDGSDGLIIDGTSCITVKDIAVKTTHPSGLRTAGTGNGITVKSMFVTLDGVRVAGFGGHGVAVLSGTIDPDGVYDNADFGNMTQVTSSYNGGDGFRFQGADSNVWVVQGADATGNAGWGYYNDGMYHNTFITPHASANTAGEFYDDAFSSFWINPYSEHAGKFVIGNGSLSGYLLMGGPGAPEVWSNGVNNAGFAGSLGWTVIRDGKYLTALRLQTSSGTIYNFRTDGIGTGSLELRNVSDNFSPFAIGRNDGTGSWRFNTATMGFFNATPVTRRTLPAAATDEASAIALANALRQAMIDLGLGS